MTILTGLLIAIGAFTLCCAVGVGLLYLYAFLRWVWYWRWGTGAKAIRGGYSSLAEMKGRQT